MEGNVIYAFSLTLFAGLSTGIGSLISLLSKRTDTKALSVILGFAGGVMIYISFLEMMPHARIALGEQLGINLGGIVLISSFFGGILITALIDMLVPHVENPHEIHMVEELEDKEASKRANKLFRMGFLTALVISIHNFPEGMAAFITALEAPTAVSVSTAVAIAIHNIPEGIMVFIPIYYATGSRRKAFVYSFLSGLTEPLGALIGYFILRYFLVDVNGLVMGINLAVVSGIMFFISVDQLLPTARKYGEHHLTMYGLLVGMLVMALGLVYI